MTYLTMALWAEGPSDGPFLRPLLRRTVTDLALRSQRIVEIADDFISLPDPGPDHSRDDRIQRAVSRRCGEISLLFIHSDGKGKPDRAREQAIQPAIDKIRSLRSPPQCVAVVPVHETEAWILADPSALGQAIGVSADHLTSCPTLNQIERLPDPKGRFTEIRNAVRRGKRRLPLLALGQIGETVDLQQLRRLGAFQTLENELRLALVALHIL